MRQEKIIDSVTTEMRISARSCIIVFLCIMCVVPRCAVAQTDSLQIKIEQIVRSAKGNIGVAIRGVETDVSLLVNGHAPFPMQSVYKFPLALAVLNQVDKGVLSLDQHIFVKKAELLPNTWSPLREKYPEGNVSISLDELLTYAVSQSDNNGTDILFRLVGGPNTVNRYIHSLGVTEMAIVSTEEEMHGDGKLQYRNWSSPSAMAQLLYTFRHDSILSQRSREYLWRVMITTKTGTQRLKGLLPEGTVVAHKTGSSGVNEKGVAAATNDVGVVTLPNGKHLIMVVFISDSDAGEKSRDEVIAVIAKTVWDVYSVQ